MDSKFFLALGIVILLAFGALAAFHASSSLKSPSKGLIEKEVVIQMHDAA